MNRLSERTVRRRLDRLTAGRLTLRHGNATERLGPGGIMPSLDLISRFDRDLEVEARWGIDGRHYSRTARAWRENLEAHGAEVMPVLVRAYGADARRWFHRWRLFFLGCEELFGYRYGREWMIGHYRIATASSG